MNILSSFLIKHSFWLITKLVVGAPSNRGQIAFQTMVFVEHHVPGGEISS